MKKLAATILAFGIVLSAAHAGSSSYYYSSKAPAKDPIPLQPENCFYAGESFLDIFGVYADPEGGDDQGYEDSIGGGLGLGHFFTEYLGARGRAYWWDGGSAVHSINADLILRAPIQSLCIAPYIYGGVGGAFDSTNQFTQHVGGGLEMRLTGRVGVFADYSRTFADDTGDWNLYSLGMRILF